MEQQVVPSNLGRDNIFCQVGKFFSLFALTSISIRNEISSFSTHLRGFSISFTFLTRANINKLCTVCLSIYNDHKKLALPAKFSTPEFFFTFQKYESLSSNKSAAKNRVPFDTTNDSKFFFFFFSSISV